MNRGQCHSYGEGDTAVWSWAEDVYWQECESAAPLALYLEC